MRAMILAAGRGVRMGSLTAAKPKPLLELDGQTLIERQLRSLAASGVRTAVINLSWRGEQIREAIGDGSRFGIRVEYSDEGPAPLETAGGIIQALPLLGHSPFVVVNADVVSDFDYTTLDLHAGHGQLVLVPNPEHNPSGDYGIDGDSRLTKAEPRYTYAGISLLSPDLFAGLERGRRPLSEVFDAALATGALRGVVHGGFWMDIGTPERLQRARERFG